MQRLRLTVSLVALVALAPLVPACDDGPDGATAATGGTAPATGGTEPATVATPETYAKALAARYCGYLDVCCVTVEHQPRDDCRTRVEAAELEVATRGTYDAARGAACLDAIAGYSCGGTYRMAEACDEVFRFPDYQKKKVGESCTDGDDCIAPDGRKGICLGQPGATTGTCRAWRYGKPGDACQLGYAPNALEFDTCEAKSFCDEAKRFCVATPVLAQACPSGRCERSTCLDGTCVAFRARGETCNGDTNCFSLVCDPATKTCAAARPVEGELATQCQ